MNDWMQKLAAHYERARRRHPGERLLVLFDIDGTILDMRHVILHALRSFDREHGTNHFAGLGLDDISIHEDELGTLLGELGLPAEEIERVTRAYLTNRWSSEAILASHRPFRGVMEVIRWFQMQPDTFVGLNTGRPESLRTDTIRSLNLLGREYKVWFDEALLFMNPRGWGEGVEDAKVAGIECFRRQGYRVVAFVDNEPANLEAVARIPALRDILLLHADTIFRSRRQQLPARSVSGTEYDVEVLGRDRPLPSHVTFVWGGLNDCGRVRRFAGANVRWGEVDVEPDPATGRPVIRKEPDADRRDDRRRMEDATPLEDFLGLFRKMRASVRINLHGGQTLVEEIGNLLARHEWPDASVWFHAGIDAIGEEGFRRLRAAFPAAILQCPADSFVPLILGAPDKAHEVFDLLVGWGVSRFSLRWGVERLSEVLNRLEEWGLEVHLDAVDDPDAFLRAVLLAPRSMTSPVLVESPVGRRVTRRPSPVASRRGQSAHA